MGFIINPFWATAPVTPATYTPFRWYDAATYALADNADITPSDPWIDQSANLSNATSTLTFEPTFETNIFGVLPAVRLLTPSHLVFDSGFFTLTDLTIICIARVNGDSIWLSRNTFNRQIRASRSGVNESSFYPGTGAEVVSGVLAVTASDARMLVWRRNTGTGVVDFYENDTLFPGNATNSDGMEIGQIGIIDGGPLNIDIGELVIYSSTLTDQNVEDLYNDYFKPKFSLP